MKTESSEMISKQVALHTEYITDFQRVHDYGFVKLWDATNEKLISPPNLMRRGNDVLAAAYLHALAINQDNGDDCIDAQGNHYELKLAYVKSRDMSIGKRGALIQGTTGNPENTVQARFKVYPGTNRNHHNKNTALILMSYDHNCFITGFMLEGGIVGKLLHEGGQKTIARTISLSNFIKYGYEFGSSIPHIGWQNYQSTLFDYVKVREQRITGDEADAVVDKWVGFADTNNLQKL
jgi:hypothetical protein